MNNYFERTYIDLLERQVNEELDFLLSKGHGEITITCPCIFCVGSMGGNYVCGRMQELKHFRNLLWEKKNKRRKIGYEVEGAPIDIHQVEPNIGKSHLSLPLLSISL